jgi:hypothetical protein
MTDKDIIIMQHLNNIAKKEFLFIRDKINRGKNCSTEIKETFTLLIELYIVPSFIGRTQNDPIIAKILGDISDVFNNIMYGIIDPINVTHTFKYGNLSINFSAPITQSKIASNFLPTSYDIQKEDLMPHGKAAKSVLMPSSRSRSG